MRRLLLAAMLVAGVLAAPAAVHAQATPGAGQVTFDVAVIGPESCSSLASGNPNRQIHLAWQDQLDTSVVSGSSNGVFRVYATNQVPPTTSGARYCAITDNLNATGGPVYAGQVGSDIANSSGSLSSTAYVNAAQIGQKAGGCNLTAGQAIYVCVHFYPIVPPLTTPQATPTAWAVGQMTLSLTTPGAVQLNSVQPGNQALNASWSSGSNAAKYKVLAVSLADPSLAPSPGVFNSPGTFTGFNPADPTPHVSGFVTGTGPYRLAGLVNNVYYGVSVIAYTDAEAPSDPSNVITGFPELTTDFWETYKADGGRETGGCSSGVAGPIGLLALAGALALVRRRK